VNWEKKSPVLWQAGKWNILETDLAELPSAWRDPIVFPLQELKIISMAPQFLEE